MEGYREMDTKGGTLRGKVPGFDLFRILFIIAPSLKVLLSLSSSALHFRLRLFYSIFCANRDRAGCCLIRP